MIEVVHAGFRGAVKLLESELQVMPLSRWNESVLRYYFCRSIATAHPDAEQLVECGRIDLVLAQAAFRAFVEFKFYWHPLRFDPYGLDQRGFKGGVRALRTWASFRHASISWLSALQRLGCRSTSSWSMRTGPKTKADKSTGSRITTMSTSTRRSGWSSRATRSQAGRELCERSCMKLGPPNNPSQRTRMKLRAAERRR